MGNDLGMHVHETELCATHNRMSWLICAPRTSFFRHISAMDSGDEEKRERAARLVLARKNFLGLNSKKKDALDLFPPSMNYYQHENGNRKIEEGPAKIYADVYGVPVEWLLYGDNPPAFVEALTTQKREGDANVIENKDSIKTDRRVQKSGLQSFRVTHKVPLLGIVEAGAFREMYAVGEPTTYIPLSAPELLGNTLGAYEVAGDSMNLMFQEGTRVIAGSPFEEGLHDGDYVVLRRRSHGLAETSIKQLEIQPDGTWHFCPRSTNTTHQPIIAPPFDEFEQDGLEIVGIVLFEAPRPIKRKGRRVTFSQRA